MHVFTQKLLLTVFSLFLVHTHVFLPFVLFCFVFWLWSVEGNLLAFPVIIIIFYQILMLSALKFIQIFIQSTIGLLLKIYDYLSFLFLFFLGLIIILIIISRNTKRCGSI